MNVHHKNTLKVDDSFVPNGGLSIPSCPVPISYQAHQTNINSKRTELLGSVYCGVL